MTRIILAMSLDPALNRALSPGAYRCLALVRSLAGKARVLRTLTCSIARQMDRCVNTVRTYRDQLVAAGYLAWATNRRSGVSTIEVLASVEVQTAGQGRVREKASWPVEPTPAPWLRRGAQFLAHINRNPILKGFLATARGTPYEIQPPRYTPEEQIAILLSGQVHRGT